jgi:hypothetical protein
MACRSTDLCEAHIVPRAFAREVRRDKAIIAVNANGGIRKPKAQDGVFDPAILCACCDRALGVFDQYGIEFCRDFAANATRLGDGWEVTNADGDRLAKFFLAILWRASISSRLECSTVKFGPFENKARDILFGTRPLSSMPAFEIHLARLESPGAKVERLFTLPERLQNHWCINGYAFILAGFYVLAKLDSRPYPKHWRQYVVGGDAVVRGTYQAFEKTGQYRALTERIWNARAQGLPGKRYLKP